MIINTSILVLKYFLLLYIYFGAGHTCAVDHMCRSEDNTRGLVLSSYYASLQYWTQSTGFGSKHLYLLSHLSGQQVYSAKRKIWTDSGMCKMLSKTRAEVNMLAIHNLNIIILQLLKLRNYQRVEKLRIMQTDSSNI